MNDQHYAVVVGINFYPAFADRRLNAARSDAEAFKEWLLDPNGGALPPANVKSIQVTAADEAAFTGIADARPKRAEIDLALKVVNDAARNAVSADKNAWGRTRLYFYVSGHGIAPQGGKAALLLADADEDMLGQNIDLSLYSNWYEACGFFHEVAIFADCCRERREGAPVATAPPFNTCPAPYAKTLTLIGYATGLGGSAYEPLDVPDPNVARGFFTAALLEGLRGAAQDDKSNLDVTSRSLGPYVRDSVVEKTKNLQVKQDVEFPTDTTDLMVFRKAGGAGTTPLVRPKRSVRIRFPAGHGGIVELCSADFTVLRTWDTRKGLWDVKDLPESLYSVRPQAPGAPPFANDGLFKLVGSDADVQLAQ